MMVNRGFTYKHLVLGNVLDQNTLQRAAESRSGWEVVSCAVFQEHLLSSCRIGPPQYIYLLRRPA